MCIREKNEKQEMQAVLREPAMKKEKPWVPPSFKSFKITTLKSEWAVIPDREIALDREIAIEDIEAAAETDQEDIVHEQGM